MGHDISVCCSEKCRSRGSDRVLDDLRTHKEPGWEVSGTDECFGYCKMGPNLSIDGNIIHGVTVTTAAERVRSEIAHPSAKVHGHGSRSLDELDDVLDAL